TKSYLPRVCTVPHQDCNNLAFGWCVVIALGDFDPEEGGHFVLHDLGIVIEFPPGACLLIPSACLWHSNIPIRKNDTRASITFYAAGNLFRFIDNEFQNEPDLAKMNADLYQQRQEEKDTHWRKGLELYSKINDLILQDL
ncbi:hypothetical protein AN958_12427, partial [Leucoagaricus sp. SymC.cos]